VSIGTELVYSKLETGKFPVASAIVDMVGQRLAAAKA
jgi:hypothetical protein